MATTQNFNYPSSSDVTVTGIGNPTGQPYPSSAVPIAGDNPSGNLTPIQTDANGNLITVPAAGSQTHVIVDSSALPTGASTSALQTSGNTLLGTIIVDLTNGSQITQITGTVPLPTGAATSALQTTGNTSLSDIDTKTPALGQALAAASVPVVLPAAQITALTPPTTVTVVQPTGTNLHTVVDTSALPTGASTAALQSSTQGSVTGGTAGTAATLVAAVYQTTLPTLTTGQQSALHTDVNGQLIVSPLTSSSLVSAIIQSSHGTLTDASGSTSATAGSSTTIMTANGGRRYLLIENISTTATIYINFTSAASAGAGSYALLPGGSIVQETGFVSTEQVNVASSVASVPFTAKWA